MELRKDYILDYYVLIAEHRAMRPNEFHIETISDNKMVPASACYFCPGNEHLTPPELGRSGTPWSVRWFANKFAAVEPTGKYAITTDNAYFTYSDAFGHHEVVVETNDHQKQLWDLAEQELANVIRVYLARIKELSQREHIMYVQLFKNHGEKAGTSLKHSHTQIVAFNHIPEQIATKLTAVNRHDRCPYCNVLNIEKDSYRRCFENEHFVAFTPYASRYNYELWIFPKAHYVSMTQLNEEQQYALAHIMRAVLARLKALNCSYNMYIHSSPESHVQQLPSSQKRGLHTHIIFAPRIDTWAGLELGAGTYINRITPEMAAAFYRG